MIVLNGKTNPQGMWGRVQGVGTYKTHGTWKSIRAQRGRARAALYWRVEIKTWKMRQSIPHVLPIFYLAESSHHQWSTFLHEYGVGPAGMAKHFGQDWYPVGALQISCLVFGRWTFGAKFLGQAERDLNHLGQLWFHLGHPIHLSHEERADVIGAVHVILHYTSANVWSV